MLTERLQSMTMRLLNHRYLAVKPLEAGEKMLPPAPPRPAPPRPAPFRPAPQPSVSQPHTSQASTQTDTKLPTNEPAIQQPSAPAHEPAIQQPSAPAHERNYMLYAHIPFCERLCPYCSFNRFPFEEQRARAYFKALRTEMRMLAELGYDFKSMYLGGGTPTVLIDELCAFIDEARELFSIEEVSCETNPNHLIPANLEQLTGRVQRLSVGVQSFDDGLLRQMERYDKYGSGMEILARLQMLQDLAAKGGFKTINADMIFNFPSQTEDMLINDLACILESGVTQTTFYPLMASPVVERSLARTVGKVDYVREKRFYEIISEVLTGESCKSQPTNNKTQMVGSSKPQATGDEVLVESNEALTGNKRVSTENNTSFSTGSNAPFTFGSAWTFNASSSAMIDEYIVDYEEYPAIGSGSFSYLGGSMYVNTFSINEYIKRIDEGRMSIAGKVDFRPYDRMRYRFMMQLFGMRLDKRQWERDFGCSVAAGLPAEYAFYKAAGVFATDTPDELTLSPKGRYLLVALMRQFFIGVNGVRDIARSSLPPEERLLFGC